MTWVDKVRIKHISSKILKCSVWIVYSQCGRFSKTFYNVTQAIEYASEEYINRLEHEEFKQMLEDRF